MYYYLLPSQLLDFVKLRDRVYSTQGDPVTILSGMGNGHTKMICACDWNQHGILTTGLDRGIVLWNVSF